jgi:ribosomal protein S18 acetylase RimI-like enzyme
MKPIDSLSQYTTIINDLHKLDAGMETNCYLLSTDLQSIIDNKSLVFQSYGDFVIFLRREIGYYNFYFYLTENSKASPALEADLKQIEKPLIADIVFQENRAQPRVDIKTRFLENCGFKFYQKYIQLDLSHPDLYIDENLAKDLATEVAGDNDWLQIQNLWKTHLDPYSTSLPQADELLEILREGRCRVIYKDSEVIAVLLITQHGRSALISHVVVQPSFRGLGVAKALMIDTIRSLPEISRFQLWVAENNSPANTLYLKLGFNKNNKTSYQYILDQNRK